MSTLNIEHFLQRLRQNDALRDTDAIDTREVGRIEPSWAANWPQGLNPQVREALQQSGIGKLYQHQAHAMEMALAGNDIVLESPTASGKTLSFTVPMLHVLKEVPRSHAMMIYPMKALAYDQREQLRKTCEPLDIESWSYDGDSDDEHKRAIRQRPSQVLLTNPEYLNQSFLGNRDSWNKYTAGARFLRNLRYIVIDEMHEYRGYFGSNMALLLRRFFLYLKNIGARPQIFLSTATCANPQEHAFALTGRKVELVSARDAMRPLRHFIFIEPDIPEYNYAEILRIRIEQAAISVLEQGLQTLIFCPTKRFLETALGNARRKAVELGFDPETVSAYHADLKSEQRQRIQELAQSGEIRVIFATNALELGLDIGGMDGIIMAGFPPNIMSAWQQVGRAGRSWDRDAFLVFYAMNDPIDRFFVSNLSAFLDKPFDELIADHENPELIRKHLPSLVEEANGRLSARDEDILGAALYGAAKQQDGFVPSGTSPQQRLKLRGIAGQSFKLRRGNEEIGQVSAMRRFREAYLGAVFPFFGRRYLVSSHEEQAIVLQDCEPHLKTEPRFYSTLSRSTVFDGFSYGDIRTYYGSLDITLNFNGYRLVDERNDTVLREGGTEDALFMNNLHSLWIELPRGQLGTDGIGALEHMLRVGSMFVIPVDRFDTSSHSRAGDEQMIYIYENYPGGIGAAKKLLHTWDKALRKGMQIASECRCTSGCQLCIEPAKSWDISNAHIDKLSGIELAKQLLASAQQGPTHKFEDGLMVRT